jgi:hypothetical protein
LHNAAKAFADLCPDDVKKKTGEKDETELGATASSMLANAQFVGFA